MIHTARRASDTPLPSRRASSKIRIPAANANTFARNTVANPALTPGSHASARASIGKSGKKRNPTLRAPPP